MTEWTADRLRAALRVYLLADASLIAPERLVEAVAAAIRGGVTAVQLRAKEANTVEHLELARALNDLCAEAGLPLIVNERIDVALAAGADGAHLGHIGEEESSPIEARHVLGPDSIVGVSVSSPQQARLAAAQGASYVTAGPMFASLIRSEERTVGGEPLLRSVRAATRLPLVVIGGINADRAPGLFAAGADGVCVGAAILRAADVEAAARAFVPSA
jgi:thiamine-phosphate pyrophosphorylase